MIILGIVIVIFWLTIIFGDMTYINSSTHVMFLESFGRNYWNAEYQYFDGFMQRTLRMEEDDVLHVSIETVEGDLDVEVINVEGDIIYSEESVGTKEFDIDVSGKVSVRVIGEEHEGRFGFE